MRSVDSSWGYRDGHLTEYRQLNLLCSYIIQSGCIFATTISMKRDKKTGVDRLKQLVVPLGAPPTYRAAVLLLCVTAGCADVDTHTSVTHEAVTITTIPVSGAINPNPEEATFGPMVAVADF